MYNNILLIIACIMFYVIACTATDGSMVAAGTSFMDDCNMW